MSNFYSSAPTPETAWRIVILLGNNTRTYKFALGHALVEQAKTGQLSVSLEELASTYALELARHSEFPQAPKVDSLGENDFLTILKRERLETLELDSATKALTSAAMKSMPGMVMQKFHNLPSGFPAYARFYTLEKVNGVESVFFTDEMLAVAASDSKDLLVDELNARWNIVEASFDLAMGETLRNQGVIPSQDYEFIEIRRANSDTGKLRRPAIAKMRESLSGFQSGVCFHCQHLLAQSVVKPHVDHVIPRSFVTSGLLIDEYWRRLNLDHVWNLVVSCAPCNLKKSNSPPDYETLNRLRVRNDLILKSPHPLKQSIRLLTGDPSEKFYLKLFEEMKNIFGARVFGRSSD